ncbi:MAG TPA: serine protease [Solirubrobacterales bacterium]
MAAIVRLKTAAALAFLAIATALLCASAALGAGAHASVIGGEPASITQYPWLAFIEGQTGPHEGFDCSGTVVAPRVILTAGHCVLDIESGKLTPAADYAVATGVADLHTVQPTNVFRVSQALVNPDFQPSLLRNDAGLLILSTPTSAPPIPLATGANAGLLASGTPLAIAGWGLTDGNAKEIDGVLRSATTLVQSASYCKGKVSKYYPFFTAETQLCAIDPPAFATGTCHGDSGGPAIATENGTPVQVGVTSLGESKCATSLPDVFTRVDKIEPWVAAWIAAVETGAPPPTVKVPKTKLPLMTMSRARYFVARGLAEDFHHRFTAGSEKTARCRRLKRERVRCDVSWFQGGNDYFGKVTVFYVLGREEVLWNDRYTIHWVDDQCWHGGHRGNCPIHTQSR